MLLKHIPLIFQGDNYEPSSFVMKVLKAVLYSISVLVLMAISSAFIKVSTAFSKMKHHMHL